VKRAFTLIELLVVIAIIAILAAILFPVFAQAKVMAKKASDLSNNKQINLSTIMYGTDNDDLYPFQSGALSTTGQWGGSTIALGWQLSSQQILVPYNWTTQALTVPQVQYSQGSAPNTIQPYAKNVPILGSPGGTTDPYPIAANLIPTNPAYLPIKITYAYNGLLSGYNTTSIQSPTTVPIWTSMNGSLNGGGWTTANPQLACLQPATPCTYVPAVNGCANGTNGQRSYVGVTGLPLWTFNQGQNWAYFDGHAKYRKVGVTSSNTNFNTEPSSSYNSYGVETGTFWNDGCHAWLFRPDYIPASGFN
jgi:prepilin-type N-terminal cleavage/methylation domain-containing protein